MGNGGGLGRLFRALFGILILGGFVLCLVVGMLESSSNVTSETKWINSEAGSSKQIKVSEKVKVRANSDFNYDMSKRRVPNGPDPIHNRKAGNSGRTPGQA